jgi:hypothetical protein
MVKLLTILAKNNEDYREVYELKLGGDESLYLEPSRKGNPHISLHVSGDFHVKYPEKVDAEHDKVAISDKKPLSSFKGISSPNVFALVKSEFGTLKERRSENITTDKFVIELDKFTAPIIDIAIYLFDSASEVLLDQQTLKLKNAVGTTVNKTTPNIRIVAYEHQD